MDDFDETYRLRQQMFKKGVQQGQIQAEKIHLQEIMDQASLFARQFAQELGTYNSYLLAFDELKVEQRLPLLKLNDVVREMKSIINGINFTSLPKLREEREILSRKYHIICAMTGIKKSNSSIPSSENGLTF